VHHWLPPPPPPLVGIDDAADDAWLLVSCAERLENDLKRAQAGRSMPLLHS
jgi:hypothetical protein